MTKSVIHTEGLTRKFGDFVAVNAITFDVKEGEIFGFLGANGAGKTTAMRILCGLLEPTSGKASVAGYDVYRQNEEIKKHIGYMSQKFSLYENLTVRENIQFFGGIYGLTRKELREKTAVLIERLGLNQEADKLVGSLAETLAFARADAMESSPERFDFAALLQTLVDEREDLGRDVSYKGPQSLIVEGRAGALKRALANLIDNALIYGERAEVTLAEYPDRIEAAIVDEGPGIPPEELEQVFRPFYRLEASRSRETGGSGLGLAVARDIAVAHGGEVRLENRATRGLRATLVLPRVG